MCYQFPRHCPLQESAEGFRMQRCLFKVKGAMIFVVPKVSQKGQRHGVFTVLSGN